MDLPFDNVSRESLQKRANAYLAGLSSYLPKGILTNQDLEKMVDTNDQWIQTRTGIRQRHIAAPDEATSDMAIFAGRTCLQKVQKNPLDVQLVILATMTGDSPCPATASIVASALGCLNAGCFDLQAACSGFIYSLSTAKAFIQSGQYKTILLIASEKMSSVVDYTDRNTCILFGDGAAACLVSSVQGEWLIADTQLGSDGSGAFYLSIPGGGSKEPASADSFSQKRHFLKMEGKEVFKHAVRRMQQVCQKCLKENHLTPEQIRWLVCHQANERIIDALVQKMGFCSKSAVKNLDRLGNTSAASIPLALREIESNAIKDQLALLASFGAGFSWAAALLKRI